MIWRYKRVRVYEGKHGDGDFRVEFGGGNPTHGEMLAMLHWILTAEDRYSASWQAGRAMFMRHAERVYYQDAPIENIISDVDGRDAAATIWDSRQLA